MDVKDIIRKRRLELGLTYEELGNAIGVGKSTVRKWETGLIENMRRDNIVALAKALNISPALIMGWDIDISEDTQEDSLTNNDVKSFRTKKLKSIILSKFGSISEFAKIVDIPSTTLISALDKGIGGMAIDRIIKICDALNIDIKTFDPIIESTNNNLSDDETTLLKNYNKLNDTGKIEANKRVSELTEINKYTYVEQSIGRAAHNDFAYDEEQQKLMQEDLDEL
ncbi:helix-turn-helix transcriptional regulator [Clostridium beijerinckii]|uniref:Transcriptional regulator with XRE-family HTH domain n=1 Tax=Clostridium beijerinckii TaxID=1520 RepID=A0AAE5H8U1_CLOBE|nr:helix-turn-helix transcriptional regulator [Clostridium beijerinckii]NSB16493.1 transcriptional regulator with XRE-family HTH domain [Clostridium beijerinckii]OOM25698.1 transcriptional repressor DicA [Clostridium beijerinckii]